MFQERFSESARRALDVARQEAQALNHDFIGPEHLLLGVLRVGEGVAATLLSKRGVSGQRLEAAVRGLLRAKADAPPAQARALTPAARQVIEKAGDLAQEMGARFVGAEHLVGAMLMVREGTAAQVLADSGLEIEAYRRDLRTLASARGEDEAESAATAEAARRQDLIRFWRQFGLMISSGVPVLQTLDIQQAETASPELREEIGSVREAIRNGQVMSRAIAAHPLLFSQGVVALCRAGEAGGVLDEVAGRIASGLESGALAVSGPIAVEGQPAAVEQAASGPDQTDRVGALIREAFTQRGADIHLEPTADGGRVRLRVDGVLRTHQTLDREAYDGMVSRLMVLSKMDLNERRRPQDGRILVTVDGRELDLRVTVVSFAQGLSAVVRILDRQLVCLDLARLGLSPADLSVLKGWTRKSNGVCIVSGPTGSGKTTLLYALIQAIDREACKVVSVENPVEYLIEGVQQAEVRPNIGCTFAALIRALMRQDPDVFLVGEIRDRETAMMLPAMSMTGHLVFSTLHTDTACEVPRRLVDIGLEPWLIKAALEGAVGMRLVRKVCHACRQSRAPEDLSLLRGLPDEDELRRGAYARGAGCDSCGRTGYRGRMGIFEILSMTPEVRGAIGDNAPPVEIRRLAVAAGMATMRHDGLRKAAQGLTTIEEVMQVTSGLTG